jgi:hypothetical protein
VPATIWFTYNPPDVQQTWFCEGEWDAILLGELARQRGEKVAIACSTAGCGTVPKPEELECLPGQVTIFYDRDEAGEKGARKLAAALGDRGRIGSVPMPDDCQVKGWDVSNAIQAGYTWEDFEAVEVVETAEIFQEVALYNESGIRFRTIRKSLDELLKTFPELESEPGQDWLKMRKFTPDHTINSQYFDWESDTPVVNLAVRSGLGTGKTFYVHNKFLADDDIGANAFGYRNALLIQFCEGAEDTDKIKSWYHLQQDLKQSKEALLLLADPKARVASCFDSLPYFQPHYFQDKRLILDEIEGSFKHLYESNTAVSFHRQLCKERAAQAIANSEAIAALDGNLTDLTVAHLERISGKRFTKVENLYKGNRGKVFLYTGTLKAKKHEETGEFVVTERKLNDYSLLHKMMMEDTEPFICGSDSQERLEAWDELLKAKGIKTFRLDGTSSNTPAAKNFLRNPKNYILENKIQVVLYSPTAESGLSINLTGYFKRCYFFFFGVVTTNEQTQFLARLRDPKTTIYVYCQNKHQKSGSPELISSDMQKFFVEYALDCSRISLNDLPQEEKQQRLLALAEELVKKSNDPHFEYECHLQAREAFERNHLRQCLEYALRTAGYQVETVTGYKASHKELNEAKKALQIKKSKELFETPTISPEEAKKKASNFEATKQDKLEVAKHRLLSRLPGIEQKVITQTQIVSLPVEAAKEIEHGRVSLELAQKLGIPLPETPSKQGSEAVHLPQNFSVSQGEGGRVPEGGNVNRNGGERVENPLQETGQNPGEAPPETQSTQRSEAVHLPQNFSISQGEGGQVPEGGEVKFVITQTKPIFDSELIRKVKFQNRTLIAQIELHFLLEHPEIAKLLQQKRWYKKLKVFSDPNEPDCVKRLNLTTYKSDWLKLYTLLEMGIGYFLNPESQWSQDCAEAKAFWEKGKDSRNARYIGTSVGESNPCEYIGRVLSKLDIKTKSDKIATDSGERVRVYRVDIDYLQNPVRQAIYECVGQRIKDGVKEDALALDWDAVVQNPEGVSPETQFPQGSEAVHLPKNFSISQEEGGQVPGERVIEPESNPVEELAVAFGFCESPTDFAAVVEGYPTTIVEDAIALQTTSRRQQLQAWSELAQSQTVSPPSALESHSQDLRTQTSAIKAGDRVFVDSCPHTDKLGPFLVEFLDGAFAKVEMFLNLISLNQLRVVT